MYIFYVYILQRIPRSKKYLTIVFISVLGLAGRTAESSLSAVSSTTLNLTFPLFTFSLLIYRHIPSICTPHAS